MDYRVYTYMQEHFSQHPKFVDSLIVSAFLKKNKITQVKNKLLKEHIINEQNERESTQLTEFIALLDNHLPSLSIESLIQLFEYVISPSDRIITGAVYTPKFIREHIVHCILDNTTTIGKNWKVADIACGCGGFLYTASVQLKKRTRFPYKDIFENNLYGLDIKEYSVNRTAILLSLLAVVEGEDHEEFKFNLFIGDALNFSWEKNIKNFLGFECIVGNPPYVCSRKIESSTKKFLKNYQVCNTGHPDLYIPFFEIGIQLLAPSGFLGYITMNSFFKSLNGRALRQYFQRKSLKFNIYDFGTIQVFKKRSTYTCICIIQNKESSYLEYTRLTASDKLQAHQTFVQLPYISLNAKSGWNLLCSKLIHQIELVGRPFSEKFKTRTGIATLKNDVYIFKPVDQDRDFYYLQNGDLFPIEKTICRQIVNTNKLTSQSDLNVFKEECIFPYEFRDGKASVFSEPYLKKKFPCAYRYLGAKKKILATRDKGKGEYPTWFAFGRTQCLELMKYKLFFPHISAHTPHFILDSDENLLFYNGLAVIGNEEKELLVLEKLMSSKLFWFYLQHTSKPYTSGYISMSRNYIKDFGIYDFDEKDTEFILSENNKDCINAFIEEKYNVDLSIINY